MAGADTVIPFKSGGKVVVGTFKLTSTNAKMYIHIHCGFVPKYLVYFSRLPSSSAYGIIVMVIDFVNQTLTRYIKDDASEMWNFYVVSGNHIKLIDDGFALDTYAYASNQCEFIAFDYVPEESYTTEEKI